MSTSTAHCVSTDGRTIDDRIRAAVGECAAPGVLRALTAAGRTVDRDVQLASCVDGVATRTGNPPITAIDLRPAAYGVAGVNLLCGILAERVPRDTLRRHVWVLNARGR
ncbi:substrate-binding domain-containing protein [Streptomyces sp. NPDC057748]|uniref:substrate-binding domain-containing protein n=1 Tax=Streptomyces sp. NPDC057748 TaxID=3346239 RepID=UPI00369CB176